MKDRRFGVEIECGCKASGSVNGYTRAQNTLHQAGKDGLISMYWANHMGRDGTMLEARSPILAGRTGFAEMRRVMNLLQENGGYVTTADGLHVHHDAPDFVDDIDATLRLVQSWVANQALIHKFVAPGRRTSHACPAWVTAPNEYGELSVAALEEYKADRVEKKKGDFKDGYWGRRDLNIAALKEHGSIEIRLHQGSLDPIVAESWIRFGQALLNKVATVKRPLTKAEDRDDLLRRIRAPKITHQTLKVRR